MWLPNSHDYAYKPSVPSLIVYKVLLLNHKYVNCDMFWPAVFVMHVDVKSVCISVPQYTVYVIHITLFL